MQIIHQELHYYQEQNLVSVRMLQFNTTFLSSFKLNVFPSMCDYTSIFSMDPFMHMLAKDDTL